MGSVEITVVEDDIIEFVVKKGLEAGPSLVIYWPTLLGRMSCLAILVLNTVSTGYNDFQIPLGPIVIKGLS